MLSLNSSSCIMSSSSPLLPFHPCSTPSSSSSLFTTHSFTFHFSPSSSFFLSSFFFISFFHPSNFQRISPNFLLIINLFHFFPHSFNLLHFPPFLNLLTLFLLPISFTFLISNVHHLPFLFPASTNKKG